MRNTISIHVIACILTIAICGCGEDKTHPQSVIVIGFDGMDPKLTQQMMDSGQLPAFAKLRDQGGFKPLRTVTPPQSPVAWATFTTGQNPGMHGLFDFIHRDPDPSDSQPIGLYSAMSKTVPDEWWLPSLMTGLLGDSLRIGNYDIPLIPTKFELLRHSTPFWQYLTDKKIPAWIYRLPANFPCLSPPSGSFHGISDMGTPDFTGGMGEFSYFSNDATHDFARKITGGNAFRTQLTEGIVLPEKPILRGTIEKIVSDTKVIIRPWGSKMPQRLDDYEECWASFPQGKGNDSECLRKIAVVDPLTNTIEIQTPCDFELKTKSVIKLYAPLVLRGPVNSAVTPAAAQASGAKQGTVYVESPFSVFVDPVEPTACIVMNGKRLILREGEWSGWQTVSFPMAYGFPADALMTPIDGMCRFYLKSARDPFSLYVSPINYDPFEPIIPLCTPGDFSGDIASVTGRYYTQGLPEDTKALSSNVLSRGEFLQQADLVEQERFRMLKYALDQFDGGFLFFYYGGTDLVAHMFWGLRWPGHPGVTQEEYEKYNKAVEKYYISADKMLATTMKAYPDATILVISDHGFANYTRGFNLNTWLVENGYAVRASDSPSRELNFDFEKSRAYAVGLNGLYINLKGREKHGIVEPVDKQALIDEISVKLLEATDPKDNRKIVDTVYQSDRVYSGPYVEIAPDLQIGYAKDYRSSWATALGAIPNVLVEDNTDAWGADHCIATHLVPGIVLSNRPIAAESPGLEDIGPTVLELLNTPVPGDLEGENILLKK